MGVCACQVGDSLHSRNAEAFFNDLIQNERTRGLCLEIALLPENERGDAVRAPGYDFTAKEMDEVVCREYVALSEKRRHILGGGDLRDIVMEKWGNHMDP